MGCEQELDRYIEFAEKIMQNNDVAQKRNGLNNNIPDVITDNTEAINSNTRWRLNDYSQLGFYSFPAQ
jgi:hypothetical protein